MSWRRFVALAVPFGLVMFALGFIVALDVQRGPNWRLELDEYVAQSRRASETITVQAVVEARRPSSFRPAIGTPQKGDWIKSSSTAQAVRCVLLLRRYPSTAGAGDDEMRQVVFLVHHSDALYRVGWLTYEGPTEPFGAQALADLEAIGCDLDLE